MNNLRQQSPPESSSDIVKCHEIPATSNRQPATSNLQLATGDAWLDKPNGNINNISNINNCNGSNKSLA
ncbi:GM25207 [Drosophila sechellia]|uniref:GM25207 n=1 Tax=Drosophila sechellia TaxID=7238 RepID=B4HLU5_DROSE|nr:GM25207 [Drosophila sechellia]